MFLLWYLGKNPLASELQNANWSFFFKIYLDEVLGFGIYPDLIKVGFPFISVSFVHWKIVLKFMSLGIIRFPEYQTNNYETTQANLTKDKLKFKKKKQEKMTVVDKAPSLAAVSSQQEQKNSPFHGQACWQSIAK